MKRNDGRSAYQVLARKSLHFVYLVGCPMTAGLAALAPEILHLMGGVRFLEGALSLRMISPIILIASLNTFLSSQVLIPNGDEKVVFAAVTRGAVSNIVMNVVLVPFFAQNGSAAAVVVSEVIVLVTQATRVCKYIAFPLFDEAALWYVIGSGLVGLCAWLVKSQVTNLPAAVMVSVLAAAVVYAAFLMQLRDQFIWLALSRLSSRYTLEG